jgi:uncharacterized protein (DUF2267 family)
MSQKGGDTMSQTGLAAFDSTLQTTNVWLRDLMEELQWADRHRAYHALRAALHALRDRLTVEQAAALGAQLPMLLRGLFYEGWHPGDKPLKQHKEEFLLHLAQELRDGPPANAEEVTRAVFGVIARHVASGEVEHIKRSLPADLRTLWPA